MTDLESFANMPEVAKRISISYRTNIESIYVCTICSCVAYPSSAKNLRCRKCGAPLLASYEKVIDIQRQIKKYNGDEKTVTSLKELMKEVRAAKREHAKLKQSKGVKRKPLRKRERRDRKESCTIYRFSIRIKPNAQYPKGFKGVMKVPEGQVAAFQKKAESMGTEYFLIATEREWGAMDSIRRAMLEVSK